jgi:hypothetical protein
MVDRKTKFPVPEDVRRRVFEKLLCEVNVILELLEKNNVFCDFWNAIGDAEELTSWQPFPALETIARKASVAGCIPERWQEIKKLIEANNAIQSRREYALDVLTNVYIAGMPRRGDKEVSPEDWNRIRGILASYSSLSDEDIDTLCDKGVSSWVKS